MRRRKCDVEHIFCLIPADDPPGCIGGSNSLQNGVDYAAEPIRALDKSARQACLLEILVLFEALEGLELCNHEIVEQRHARCCLIILWPVWVYLRHILLRRLPVLGAVTQPQRTVAPCEASAVLDAP